MFNNNLEFYIDPFPHIIVKDFIQDKDLLEYLCENDELSNYIKLKGEALGDLSRVTCSIDRIKQNEFAKSLPCDLYSNNFNNEVSRFLKSFKNDSIHKEIVANFLPYFEKEYPNFKESFKVDGRKITYGAYNKTGIAKNLLGWHLDAGAKLLSGFIYLREKKDTADDGHLYLTSGPDALIKEIRYENNVFVCWPNFVNSWHKAGVRFPTKHLRRIVNLVYQSNVKYHDYKTETSHEIYDPNELYSNKIYGFKKVEKNER